MEPQKIWKAFIILVDEKITLVEKNRSINQIKKETSVTNEEKSSDKR